MTKAQFEAETLALRDTMYRISVGLLGYSPDRADAIQSCLLKAWQHRDRLRDAVAFKPWILRILVNECRTVQRKGMRVSLADVPDTPQEMPGRDLRDAIQGLPPKLRLPVLLHYVEDMPIGDVARSLGVPAGTVKSRLSRARELLRMAIGEEV